MFILFFPLGAALNPQVFLASPHDIAYNFLALSVSMNGAWWFLLPYAVLTLLSGHITKLVYSLSIRKEAALLAAALGIHIAAYIYEKATVSDITALQLLYANAVHVPMLGFVFMAGISCAKHGWADTAYRHLRSHRHLTPALASAAAALLAVKLCIGASALLNPWFVFLLVPCYAMAGRGRVTRKTLFFFGKHSTNMWLTHFFYAHYIFGDIIYTLRYPVLIYAALITVSLASSFAVDALYKPVRRAIASANARNRIQT